MFGNAEIEMLFTYEDLMPFYITVDNSNPTSLVFSITIEGQRLMILGDASREGLQVCVDRYGSYLRSAFVQLSHHGWGSGGSPEQFYRDVNAEVVFCPGTGYGAAEEWAANNAQTVYLRSNGTVTVSLPLDISDKS